MLEASDIAFGRWINRLRMSLTSEYSQPAGLVACARHRSSSSERTGLFLSACRQPRERGQASNALE